MLKIFTVGNHGITKVQQITLPTKETLIAHTGGSRVSEEFNMSHIITIFRACLSGKDAIYPLKSFADPVVDFVFYPSKDFDDSKPLLLLSYNNYYTLCYQVY